jgi:hypothetical protein
LYLDQKKKKKNQTREITKSSIFKIILTHSVASTKALSVTSVGYITLDSEISLTTLPFLT